MEDTCDRKEQSNEEDKLNDELVEKVLTSTEQSSCNDEKKAFISTNMSCEDGNEEKKGNTAVNENTEVTAMRSDQSASLYSQENKSSNVTENITKRPKYHADDKNDILYKCNSNEDCSKRQKLNESHPNTSTASSPRSNTGENLSHFRKLESKFKKRNYRSQRNSIDDTHESSEPVPPNENIYDESSSSESDEKSDVPEEENCDSNELTTSSEDDTDDILAILEKKPLKSDWSIIKDVINRQIGFNNSIHSRFYSSLHAVQHLELMHRLEEHLGCVNAIGFNQKGNILASASDDLMVTIWDWATGKKYVSLNSGHRSNVFQSKWSPLDKENFVVTCARDGQVRLLDIQIGISYKLAHHRAACHKISVHLDLPHIVLSAGEDSKVLSIDVRENKPSKLLSVKDNDEEVELYSIHSNPLNHYEFCVAGRTRYVKVYDRRIPTVPLYQLCPKSLLSDAFAQVTCAVYNHNGTEVLASYNNENIYLFDTSNNYQIGDFAHKYLGHRNSATVKGVNFFGPNSEYILSGSDCGNIFIWEKKTEAIVQWMPGDDQGIVNTLEPHPHIPILATSGLDYDVKIWIPSRDEPPNIKPQLQSCIVKNLMERKSDENAYFNRHFLSVVLRDMREAVRHTYVRMRRGNGNESNAVNDGSDIEFDYDDEDDDEDDDDDDDDGDDVNDDSTFASSNNFSESDNHSES